MTLGWDASGLVAGAVVASLGVKPVYIQRVVGNATTKQLPRNQNLCASAGTADCSAVVTIAGTATIRLAYPSAGSTTPIKNTTVSQPNPPISFDWPLKMRSSR